MAFCRTRRETRNVGSADESRFTREHATDFFAHLGAIASFALENVVNRARLLRSGFTDVLTGWHNRRYLQVRLHEELARARKVERYRLTFGAEREPKIQHDLLPVEEGEPLRIELEAFVEAVRTRSAPAVDGRQARRAIALAHQVREAIDSASFAP